MKTLPTTLLLAATLLPVAAAADVAPEKLYEKHCVKCHGEDGRAKTWRGRAYFIQDFTDAKFQKNNSDDEIMESINRGPRIMPSHFADTLSRGEREGLVKLIRGFGKVGKPTMKK